MIEKKNPNYLTTVNLTAPVVLETGGALNFTVRSAPLRGLYSVIVMTVL